MQKNISSTQKQSIANKNDVAYHQANDASAPSSAAQGANLDAGKSGSKQLKSGEDNILSNIKIAIRELERAIVFLATYVNPIIEIKHYSGLYINHGKERNPRNPALEKELMTNNADPIFRTYKDVNGLPYVMEEDVSKLSLKDTSIFYKNTRESMWHIPEDQFVYIKKLHEMAPDVMADAIALVKNKNSETVGYLMERTRGVPLEDAITSGTLTKAQKEKIWKSLSDTVMKFHRNGLGHGDLNTGNIIITSDFRVKLIDPLDDTKWNRWLSIKEDMAWLDYIHSKLV